MPALYFSTQMARASAFPARILGGGLDPLPSEGGGPADPAADMAAERNPASKLLSVTAFGYFLDIASIRGKLMYVFLYLLLVS